MAYDEQLWEDIKLRFLKKEPANKISKTLGGKPSAQAIRNRAKEENWKQDKVAITKEVKEKTLQNFADFLLMQHETYEKIATKFNETIDNKNELGIYSPFCSITALVGMNKDWREVFLAREKEEKGVDSKEEQNNVEFFLELAIEKNSNEPKK